MILKEMISYKGSGKVNEDAVGYSKKGAWVLDGATGLNGKNIVDGESDAKWYSQWWNEYLKDSMDSEEPLNDIMRRGINKISVLYKKKISDSKIEKIDLPSASVSAIKMNDREMEFFILGDCNIYLVGKNLNSLKDWRVGIFDSEVYKEMRKIQVSDDDAENEKTHRKVREKLVYNRKQNNTDGGYWILSFSEDAVSKSVNGSIRIGEDVSIIMASDGFTCCCERYDIFTEEEMVENIIEKGADYVYKKIREYENNPENDVKVPRFKKMDDSTCIYVEVEKERFL